MKQILSMSKNFIYHGIGHGVNESPVYMDSYLGNKIQIGFIKETVFFMDTNGQQIEFTTDLLIELTSFVSSVILLRL